MRTPLRKNLLAFGILTLACSSGDITGLVDQTGTTTTTSSAPASVAITPPTNTTLVLGTSISLAAAAKTATGQDIGGLPITWSSSDESVATVSPTGVLTVVRAGTVTITATSSGKSASITFTIVSVPVKSFGVTVKPNLLPGESATATATALDSIGGTLPAQPVVWSTANPFVAIVNGAGIVTGIGAGTTDIIATSGAATGSSPVTVLPFPIQTITVSVNGLALQVGATTTATATARDAGGNVVNGHAVAWSSSNTAIATVNQAGVITAVSFGSVVISATADGQTGTVTLTVAPPAVASITITLAGQLAPATTTQGSVVLKDALGNTLSGRTVNWASSNAAVASVDQTGLVTAKASGTTVISASSGNISGSVSLTVFVPPGVSTVSLASPNSTLQPGQTTQLTSTIYDNTGKPLSGGVTYSSSTPSVAKVSASGLVTAVAGGIATISGTSGTIVGTIVITVPTVATINVSTLNTTLQPTQSTQASFTLTGSDGLPALNRATTWSSSNPAVAIVSNGFVTALGPGTAQITVTSEGQTGSATITVPPVASVTISSPSVTLQPTQTVQAAATLLSAGNLPVLFRQVNWTSSNPAVADVNSSGTISGLTPGTAVITATSEGVSGTISVTIPPVATINVTAPAVTRQPGQVTTAAFTLLDASGQPCLNRAFTWSSSNTAIATVSSTGVVTAVGPGTAQISVQSEGKTGSLAITVPPVVTVTPTAQQLALSVAQTTQISVVLLDANGLPATNRTVTYSSASPAVATVTSTGLVAGVSLGTTVITITSEGKTATLTFSVIGASSVGSIAVSSQASALMTTQTTTVTAQVLDNAGNPSAIPPVWSSSDPTKATVTAAGVVTAVNGGPGGLVSITATAGGRSASTGITITGHAPESLAQLPQVFLNTTPPPAPDVGGQIFSVSTNAQFNTALANAQYGDVIELANGATFTGQFILPLKGANNGKWITIRPANSSGLPAPGSRMTPSIAAAAQLPLILSPSNAGAIVTSPSSHHYRIIGLEVSHTSTAASNTGLVRLGEDGNTAQTTFASIPHDIVLDRMYIHGSATLNTRRCVGLNDASSAVIDSYLSDCHESGADAQAIAGWNGQGPFKIVNNYLEASGENIMFGGSDPAVPNLTPSDIEIRHNHFFKPPAWKGIAAHWLVKNLFELKHAQRVLVEGNLFENNWSDGQVGTGISMKTVNQGGGCTWCVTQHVTFRYNMMRNVGGAFTLSGSPDNAFQDIHANHLTVVDNIVYTINTSFFDGIGQGLLLNGDVGDVVFAHNTIMAPSAFAIDFGGGPKAPNLTIRDNLITGGAYGVKGPGTIAGTATITAFTSGNTYFVANGIQLPSSPGYPAFNTYPANVAAYGFVNMAGFDFHLVSSSPFKNKSSDMRDVGADVDAVLTATANVIVP